MSAPGILAHRPRVADHIGDHDRRQSSLNALFGHGQPSPRRALGAKFYVLVEAVFIEAKWLSLAINGRT